MNVTYTIDRQSLKNKEYKKRVTKKSGSAPTARDTEALSVLLKELKKA